MSIWNATVFMSCGQRAEENETVSRIETLLRDLGYTPYRANEQHTLDGVRQNIFAALESSEYYLFIDFPRERLGCSDERRGSLFTHQELAIASYLKLPALGFRHRSVKRLDGLTGSVLLNAQQFGNEADLLTKIETAVKTNWMSNWNNRLLVTRNPEESDLVYKDYDGSNPRVWYHMLVKNLHHSRWARSCAAYVTSVRNAEEGQELERPLPIELRWSARTGPFVHIGPCGIGAEVEGRMLDAGFVEVHSPSVFHHAFYSESSYTRGTSSRYSNTAIIEGPGIFEIEYVVVSENFPLVQATLILRIGKGQDPVILVQKNHG